MNVTIALNALAIVLVMIFTSVREFDVLTVTEKFLIRFAWIASLTITIWIVYIIAHFARKYW